MGRLQSVRGVILRKYRIGDIHKGLVVLTDSKGLLRVIAHGAYKGRSRFAGSSEPLTHAGFDLYHEPVKDTYKVTGIGLLDGYDRIKSEPAFVAMASYWCECFIISHAGGETERAPYALLVGALDALSGCSGASMVYADLQFAWRLLKLLGHRPEAGVCPTCGRGVAESERFFVLRGRRTFACQECVGAAAGAAAIEPGAIRYLERSGDLSFDEGMRVGLQSSGAVVLQAALHQLVESVLETELKALRVGAAIG